MNNDKKNYKNPSSYFIEKKDAKPLYTGKRLVTTKLGVSEKVLHKEKCPILEVCGSCSILNLNYKSQLLQKTNKIKEKLKEFGALFSSVSVQHFIESEEKLAYRHSVKLVVSDHFVNGKQWIDIGFYRQSVNKIVDIGNCPVQTNILNDILYYLRSAFKIFQTPIYSPKRKTGILSGVILRSSKATRQSFVTLLVREINIPAFRELACSIVERLPYVQGVFLQLENYETSKEKEIEPVLLAGNKTIEEKFGTLDYKINYNVEVPIHPSMMSKIYSRVEELCDLSGTQNILHLYSGLGALTCILAKKAKLVTTIDEKDAYAKNTEMNLQHLKLRNILIQVGKVKQLLVDYSESCDALVVTAPRHGLGAELIKKIVAVDVKKIVIVSSFNDEFLSDLSLLVKKNMRPMFIEPFDTHPGTPYFDVLCYLQRM